MSWSNHPDAPTDGQRLCEVEDVPEGECLELRFGPEADVLSLFVHRSGDAVRAYLNRCPHFSLPLNARPGVFLVLEGGRILCPHHSAVFRLEDGRGDDSRCAAMSLHPVPIEVREGIVFVASGHPAGAQRG